MIDLPSSHVQSDKTNLLDEANQSGDDQEQKYEQEKQKIPQELVNKWDYFD